ncbi:MAG: hypothetical protein QXP09_14155 [Saccharolobus sp.]|uniref:hypothetical protein n=1 Tax=Saccharolobus sp. TaxID=2100761 RepID=UPI002411A5C7|nr:hypothetical protein [Candidatus Parvarchaeum tengchongense]
MKDMDTIINTKGIQKGYFCKCFKQIYNALNNQLDVASTILGLVIPGLSIDEDVLKVIVAAALEYCGFTTQANELLESVVKGLIIAAIVSVLVYFIIRHK